jgi:hypothetical protein
MTRIFDVEGGLIEYLGNTGSTTGIWTSQAINIAGLPNVSFSLVASTANGAGGNGHEASDVINVFLQY